MTNGQSLTYHSGCLIPWVHFSSSSVLKVGTKVKNIRLSEGDHDIDCKIEGFGPMKLKSEFVKKVM